MNSAFEIWSSVDIIPNESNEGKIKVSDLRSGSHLLLVADQLPIYHLFAKFQSSVRSVLRNMYQDMMRILTALLPKVDVSKTQPAPFFSLTF